MYFCRLIVKTVFWSSNINLINNKYQYNMKKILFLFAALWFPVMLFAQLMDTTNVLDENFDGATIQVIPATNNFDAQGDWKIDNTLYLSSPNSYHTPIYAASGYCTMTTDAIEVTGANVNYLYLEFDQICKVNPLDNAQMVYYLGYVLSNGTIQWSAAQPINFTSSSDFYYGSATNVAGGKFNDESYNIWLTNNPSATPNNTWWKHEYFDLSSFLLNKTVTAGGVQHPATHVKIGFRLNKTSAPSSGTEVCAGWYIDNLKVILSNCELIHPTIDLQNPIYVNQNNNMLNNIGPYVINAKIIDNDTINLNSLVFTYRVNSETPVTVPNTIVSDSRTASGHQVMAQWNLPTICYYDTIRYDIHVSDVHGSTATPIDTPMIAWNNQTNIHQNDCHLDSMNTFPHCFITGVAEPVTVYFKNKSDATHSPGNPYQTSLNVTLKVENANHVVTHTSNHDWTGSLCFDERSSLDLGTFIPSHGLNYITVYINTRNGQLDGFHGTPTNISDTLRYIGYACDSLLHGDYTVGGSNPDFATMADVRNALNYCGINGPTTFHFRPGTYQDFDFRATYIGQSEVNTITFQGDDVNTVIVTNNHPDTNTNIYGAVTLINVENFIFKNLTIQGKSNAVSRAAVVRGNGSRNIVFDGCKMVANNTNTTDNTCFVIGRSVAATAAAGQVAVSDDITIQNCNLVGGNYGVYYIGSNARRNDLTLTNNRIMSCYKGIHTNYCNPIIQNNHVLQVYTTSPKNFTGIYVEQTVGADINGNRVDSTYDVEYAIQLKNATTEDFYIRNNHVFVGNTNYGIALENCSATATDTGYIYNNEVVLYPVTAAASYAVQIKNSNNLQVTNNSFYIKSDAPYSNTAALRIENNNNTYLNNNILLNYTNCSDNTNYPLYLNGTSSVTGSLNDLVSASGVIAYKTVARNTIAELEAAVTTITNNISVLPPMTNPTVSLMPTDYTGLECGRNAHVMSDIRGVQRSALTYMGAYAEQIAATDAAIVSLLEPASGTCPQSSYNITVAVANKGSEVLNFAGHNATITLHSDTLNLTRTATINSGSVAVLGTSSQVVASNVAIPVNQPIDFTFIITTNGDNNHANDTLRTMFVLEAATPDYEEDFSNGTKQTWTIEQIAGAGNWTFQEGIGSNPTIAPVYGTGRLFFNSKTFANNTESRAIMPVVNLTNAVNPILEVWFAHDNTSNKTAEGVTVKISTNGGTTFTSLNPQGQTTPLLKRYLATATTPQWTVYTYDLSQYVSAGCVHIAFDAKSQLGNNINIDRIRLRNLFDNDLAVTNIYSQGETPAQYSVNDVVKALVKNDGRQAQTNAKVYLNVIGATEQYHDTLTIPSLAAGAQTIITFPNHLYNVTEVKSVEVRSRNDENNINNACEWRMETTPNIVNYADTSAVGMKIGDYNNVIRPCVHYQATDELVVSAVKYFYDMTYIADPENGFRAFVANANGEIIATSDVINFSTLQQNAWNIIPINNFALTNLHDFYVGIEMLAHGDYLCAQIETPLRESTFFYLDNGTYVPQTSGRFMLGAVVDLPHIHDFAVLDLQNPTTRCDLGHEHITVGITNNGSQDILPGTVLKYSVNGQPAVSQTLADTVYSHQTTTFTFDVDYNFTNNQIDINDDYNIKVWVVKDAQDRLQYNDTLNMTISSLGKSPTPILANDTVIVNYYTSGTLSATMPSTISQGVFGWFTNSGYEQWNLLGYGNTYTTPVTFFDTVYYVNANPGTINEPVIGNGTVNGSQPFIFNSGYSRGKMLYTESEIGSHGTITTIGLNVATAANGADGIPIRIYMKESTESSLPTAAAAVDWASEIADATLVVDKRIFFDHTGWFYIDLDVPFNYGQNNLVIYTETNCYDYCTGTGSACNTCGAAVSGGATLPAFKQTQIAGFVQYKNGNTVASLNSNYTAFNKRLNMYFKVADLACGSEKVPVYVHVPDIPTYDVKTMSLDYPESGCALYDEHIQVRIKNLLNVPIPANKVMAHAVINGTHLTQLISEPFASEEEKVVTFDNTYNFSAPNANTTFNYTVYTTMPDEAIVYAGNDTITGSISSTRTAWMEASYTYTGEYTQTIEILQPNDRLPMTGSSAVVTKYLFYTSENATTPITLTPATAAFYTTPVLYDSVTYWVEAITKTSNCTTRRAPIYVNVFKPQYDLSTNMLVTPKDYQCGVAVSPQITVQVTNTDTTVSSVIPSGTFSMTANFTGTTNATGNTTISTTVNHLQNKNVSFTVNNLSSATQNRTYHYEIYTDPTNTSMPVYRNNDTIKGILRIPANPATPPTQTYTAPYGLPYTVAPSVPGLNYFYFYENATGGTAIGQGQNFITEPIYGPKTYYYSGRIVSDGFDTTVQAGTATASQALPFAMTSGHSYAKILYSADEIGATAGTIDTFFVNVTTANPSGVGVPVKIWMKNGTDLQGLSATPAFIWNNEVNSAQKVFDGELAFESTGWLAIPVQGGFDYTGGALYMYVEHNCGSSSCVTSLGITEPKFQNSTYSTSTAKKILQKASNTELSTTTATSFTLANYRWNTKFKFNHTCRSQRGVININTSVPQHDLGVTAITSPVGVSANYTTAETVTVTIKNYGSQAASNFPVTYQLANNTPVTETYTGSIAAGATATKTFTTHVDLSDVYYETPLIAYTDLTTDTYHGNDTCKITVSSADPCGSHPAYTMVDGADISRVVFAGIDNGPGTPFTSYPLAPGDDGLYSDFTRTVTPGQIVLGQTYPMSITHSFTTTTGTPVYKWVYIDYNRDGEFSTDELAWSSPAIPFVANGSNATTSCNIQIPLTASTGPTRMRIILASTNLSAAYRPCGIYSAKGETEDYALTILPPFETDMGISNYAQLLNNADTLCADDNAKIRVMVKNYGSQVQNFSGINQLTLTTTVTGPVPGTYTTTLDAGSLSPQQSIMLTLDNVDLSAPGTYTLNSQISYTNDMYDFNDEMQGTVYINTVPVGTIPFVQDFDQNNPDNNPAWLPANWTRVQSNNSYQWKAYKAADNTTGTYAAVSPMHDHNYQANSHGHYLSVLSNSGTAASPCTWYASVTSGCINMHYRDGYPVEVNYYDFFRAANTADFDLIVEAGNGEYYVPVDTLHRTDGNQVDAEDPWALHVSTMNGIDEVCHLRFRSINHRGKLNVAIDDINIIPGLPDLQIVKVLYPYDYRDTTEDVTCLVVGDTIYPIIKVRNNGSSAFKDFDINCIMQVGMWHDTLTAHISDVIQPGATMDYTFNEGFVLYDLGLVEFWAIGQIDLDKDNTNNTKRVIACTNSGVENYETGKGMVLYQNIPNPATTTTRIEYLLPEDGKATLNVYSAMGQLLYTDSQEALEGSNFFEMNVANLAAGVYYYTVNFNGASLTKKMVIQK